MRTICQSDDDCITLTQSSDCINRVRINTSNRPLHSVLRLCPLLPRSLQAKLLPFHAAHHVGPRCTHQSGRQAHIRRYDSCGINATHPTHSAATSHDDRCHPQATHSHEQRKSKDYGRGDNPHQSSRPRQSKERAENCTLDERTSCPHRVHPRRSPATRTDHLSLAPQPTPP